MGEAQTLGLKQEIWPQTDFSLAQGWISEQVLAETPGSFSRLTGHKKGLLGEDCHKTKPRSHHDYRSWCFSLPQVVELQSYKFLLWGSQFCSQKKWQPERVGLRWQCSGRLWSAGALWRSETIKIGKTGVGSIWLHCGFPKPFMLSAWHSYAAGPWCLFTAANWRHRVECFSSLHVKVSLYASDCPAWKWKFCVELRPPAGPDYLQLHFSSLPHWPSLMVCVLLCRGQQSNKHPCPTL